MSTFMTFAIAARGAVSAAAFAAATFAAGLTGAAHAAAAAPPTYTIQWLGDLPGGANDSRGVDINDAGQVAGYSGAAIGAGTGNRAYFWDPTTAVMTDIGALTGGNDTSVGFGINNSGQIVGSSNASTGNRAFVWSAVGGMVNLGDLPGGLDNSGARGINDSGVVVGVSFGTVSGASVSSGGSRAFAWDPVNGMVDQGALVAYKGTSYAAAINNAGTIAGGSYNGTTTHAMRKTAGGAMEDLGDLPGGADDSRGAAINASGQVVGWGKGAANTVHATLWDASGGAPQDLGELPGGADNSSATGINDAGRVVGYSASAGGTHAFVWDALWGMHDLNDLIPPGLGDVLANAGAINASGQIVGTGIKDGNYQAYVLTEVATAVPVPGALVLMLGGLGALGAVARRKAKAQG